VKRLVAGDCTYVRQFLVLCFHSNTLPCGVYVAAATTRWTKISATNITFVGLMKIRATVAQLTYLAHSRSRDSLSTSHRFTSLLYSCRFLATHYFLLGTKLVFPANIYFLLRYFARKHVVTDVEKCGFVIQYILLKVKHFRSIQIIMLLKLRREFEAEDRVTSGRLSPTVHNSSSVEARTKIISNIRPT